MFFSKHKVFGLLLFLASMGDLQSGLYGCFAVLAGLIAARTLGLARYQIQEGTYTFNSLLSGLALGAYYESGPHLIVLVILASLFSVLLSGAMAALGNYLKLPFLSLPFIFSTWLILLSVHQFTAGFLPTRAPHEAWSWLIQRTGNIELPHFISLFFRSVALIFFQNSLFTGCLITLGLIIHSRISFLLSLCAFFSGWLYFEYFQSHQANADYSFLAFNYVLSGIALGGFFLIPSRASFLLVFIATPLIALLHGLSGLLQLVELPSYSLPFSLGVFLVLAALSQRRSSKHLVPVLYQQFSPEKNLYDYLLYQNRFQNASAIAMQLPFYGTWQITQGHDGDITHKDDHRYAFDFAVCDEHKRTFKLPGKSVEDFFCYGLPILAPAAGQVVKVEDGIEDNAVGTSNLKQNWGNTIIIKHAEHLYSKLSHLKYGSIKVKEGDTLKKGELIANCGNSGRSPEPHLHFQVQTSGTIGEATICYPLSSYIVAPAKFIASGIPPEDKLLRAAIADKQLEQAFHWNLSSSLQFKQSNTAIIHEWQPHYDALLGHYLECTDTNSRAYYQRNEQLFEFTYYYGELNCALHHFFLAAQMVPFTNELHLSVTLPLSVNACLHPARRLLQDTVAAFYVFIQPSYEARYESVSEHLSVWKGTIIDHSKESAAFQLHLADSKIQSFQFNSIQYNRL